MAYVVYGDRKTRAFRVYWALEELGVPHELRSVDLRGGEGRTEEYRRIHPYGRVPAIQDGEFVLFESAAILQFLADAHPGPDGERFLPEPGSTERALANQWMFFAMSEIDAPLWVRARHSYAYPEKYRVPAILPAAEHDYRAASKVVERQLERHDGFLQPGGFSFADLLTGHCFMWARAQKLELSPGIDDYVKRLRARPAFDRARGR